MRPAMTRGVALCLLSGALAVAGGPSFEEVLKDMLGTMDKLSSTLAAIKDEAGAKAAVPELRSSADLWVKLRDKAEAMKPPSPEEKERLEKEYKAKMIAAQKKLFGEIDRVKTVEGGKEALKEISTVLTRKPKGR
jgi:hypothetical protein